MPAFKRCFEYLVGGKGKAGDRIIYLQVSEEFFKLLRTDDKKIKLFDYDHWFYDAIFYSQTSEYAEDMIKFVSSITEWLSIGSI